MVEAGVFGPGDRIELLDGEILEVSPQGSRHATAIRLVEEALRVASTGFDVRSQLPIALDDVSEPEPDVSVVPGWPRDYRDEHPDGAVLLVEVSESSLAHDRDRKLRAYARNGIPEYWILDLTTSRLEVYREPAGDAYTSAQVLAREKDIRPLYVEASIRVADLLP